MSVPRIRRLRDEAKIALGGLHRRAAGGIEIDENVGAARRVEQPGDLLHHPRQVRRTAGDVEVLAALGAAGRLERVLIEEAIARERNAGEIAVVEDLLEDVEVFRV